MTSITILAEDPRQDDVRELIAELNTTLLALTPPEFVLSHDGRGDGAAGYDGVHRARLRQSRRLRCACGATRTASERSSACTRARHIKGSGSAARILAEVEALARREGLTRLVLETGDRHPAAWRVYERGGFKRCGAVLDYPDSGYSVFYEKMLAEGVRGA